MGVVAVAVVVVLVVVSCSSSTTTSTSTTTIVAILPKLKLLRVTLVIRRRLCQRSFGLRRVLCCRNSAYRSHLTPGETGACMRIPTADTWVVSLKCCLVYKYYRLPSRPSASKQLQIISFSRTGSNLKSTLFTPNYVMLCTPELLLQCCHWWNTVGTAGSLGISRWNRCLRAVMSFQGKCALW